MEELDETITCNDAIGDGIASVFAHSIAFLSLERAQVQVYYRLILRDDLEDRAGTARCKCVLGEVNANERLA